MTEGKQKHLRQVPEGKEHAGGGLVVLSPMTEGFLTEGQPTLPELNTG